jgi:hypothetical protein
MQHRRRRKQTNERFTMVNSPRPLRKVLTLASLISLSSWLSLGVEARGLLREVWTDIPGVHVADLTNHVSFPHAPSFTNIVDDFFEAPIDVLDNYGQRMHGYIAPPQTGDYSFWISSDDGGSLFLSTDQDPVNVRVIASVQTWTASRQWDKEPNQQSSPIRLDAGKFYYVSALMKEGGGGDNLAVRWRLPDGTMEEPIPASRLLPYGVTFAPPAIAEQPADTSAVEGTTATFEVKTSNFSPVGYQWQRNSVNIAGATSPLYLHHPVLLSDDGAGFRVVLSNSLGTATSRQAILRVTPDVTAPTLVSVLNIDSTRVRLVFSEAVESASATQAANYKIDGGISVSAAQFGPDGQTILLSTSALTMGARYTVTVNGVRDRAATPNTIASNSTVSFTAVSYVPVAIGQPLVEGSTVATADGYRVSGAGVGIGGATDQFHFSYQERAGNFDVQTRVASFQDGGARAKAGLMARSSLSSNSAYAAALATPSIAGVVFSARTTSGAAAIESGGFPVNYPFTWIRLQRSGNTLRGYASLDGHVWHEVGSATMTMPDRLFVGMALSSEDAEKEAVAEFRDLGPTASMQIATSLPAFELLGPSSRRTSLVISEIMYNPARRQDEKDLQFVELFNSQPMPEDIGGFRLSGNIRYSFPKGTVIPGGGFLVVAKDPAALASAYGLRDVIGGFEGELERESGRVRLRNRADAILLEVNYSNQPPWPAGADGAGHSLVLSRPSYGENDRRAWAVSNTKGGSPGTVDAVQHDPLRSVVINEFLAHTDDPLLDFIELYNRSNSPADISGAWLSDRPRMNKFQIPAGTVIPARGFAAFTQDDLGFSLSSQSERIYFVNPDDTRVIDAISFGAQANGISSGRYPDGAPDFHELLEPTFGAANSQLLIRDVVINELMYNPISGDDADEFIELFNKGNQAVDMSHWQFIEGIRFVFPEGTTIAAGGYLVVAKDKARLLSRHANLNDSNTLGNYAGALSNSGERVALAKPDDPNLPNQDFVVVDEVTYVDGGRWGRWADRRGSSLELMDVRSDNRRAPNWADSDESAKSVWTTIEHTGVLDHGRGTADELHIMLLGEGECLIDNIEVFVQGGPNRVPNPTLEGGTASWIIQGNHVESGLANEGFNSSRSLHLRASGGGDNGANRIKTKLNSALASGSTVTIRAQARWLAGHTNLLLRLKGNYLEAVGNLPLPPNLGTPGERNSRAVPNAGPAIYDVTHSPVLPAANQPVLVTARVHDPDGISSITLYYRQDPATTFTTIPMRDDGTGGDAVAGDGLYSATLPGRSTGTLLAFHIRATDQAATPASARFPAEAPDREALVRFGETLPAGDFGTYRMWFTQSTVNRWTQREKLSNHALDGTFVYGNSRVIYNFAARYRGSPWIRPGYSGPTGGLCAYIMEMPKDDALLGATEFNLDHLEQPGRDNTLQREKMSFWIADQLDVPFSYQRYIRLFVNGVRRGTVYSDSQQINPDYISSWFPNSDDGEIFKIDDWFEFNDNVDREFNIDATLQNFTTTGGAKKQARYRWNWEKKSNKGLDDDYTRLFELVDAVNTQGEAYTQAVESVVDLEQWMRVFAVRHIVADWDGYGYNRGKNQFAYFAPGYGWQMLLWDLDFSLGGGSDGATANIFAANDSTVTRMYNHPPFRRAYLRAMHDAVHGPLLPERMNPVMAANYAALLGNQVSVTSPSGIQSWVTQRRNYIIQQLNQVSADFRITSNNGNNFSTPNNLLTLQGSAPVQVRTIKINGAAYPTTWATVTEWRMRLPLLAGANLLTLQGYDSGGKLLPEMNRTITVTFTGPNADSRDHLVINEIMYHPVAPNTEFVEIHNTSKTHAFDLTGHRLAGVDFDFSEGTIIEPDGFVVVAKNRAAFAATYGSGIPVAGEFTGRLQHAGERLRLLRLGSGAEPDSILNEVTYSNQLPWPVAADGKGASLQLIDPSLDNNRPGNWAAISPDPVHPEPVALVTMTDLWKYNQSGVNLATAWRSRQYDDGSWPAGRALLYVENSPLPAPKNTPLILGATTYYFRASFDHPFGSLSGVRLSMHTIIDDGAVFYLNGTEVFRLGMPPGPVAYSTFANRTVDNAVLEGPFEISADQLLPGSNVIAVEVHQVNAGSSDIVFGMSLTGELRQSKAYTPGAPNSIRTELPQFPPLWINEIQPVNLTGRQDNAGERDPWVELYNSGASPVSLDGFHLTDSYSDLTRWAFPANASIGPGQFLVIWLDAQPQQTTAQELHASFQPSPNSGTIALVRRLNGQNIVVDHLDYASVLPDRSFGLFPDGRKIDPHHFFFPTPGTANSLRAPAVEVVINEWMAQNRTTLADPADGMFDDWFELYNPNAGAADLSGFTLTDDLSNPARFIIPQGVIIPPKGFLLVWADGQPQQNGFNQDLHVNFSLNREGEAIGLFAPDGTPMDTVVFGPQTADVSQGRFPDGASPPFVFMNTPTPGAPNVFASDGTPHIDASSVQIGANGTLTITWAAEPGRIYRVQYKNDLRDSEWLELAEFAAQSNVATFTDDSLFLNQQRFYRIIVPQP